MTWIKNICVALAFVGVVLLLPLIVPTALVMDSLYRYRLRSAAGRFACTGCGQILGRESLRLADIEWANRMEEMRIKHPDVKWRVVRDVHAICPNCWKCHRYLEEAKDFQEVPERPLKM